MSKEIGVLWVNEYKKDGEAKKMLSGKLDMGPMGDVDIVIFPNERKKEEKQPAYRIFLSDRQNRDGSGYTEKKDTEKVKPF